MERNELLKLIVLFGALVMAGSMLAPAFLYKSSSGGTGTSGTTETGTALFNGTIRTYNPILLVKGQLSTEQLTKLQMDSRVKSVSASADGYIINTTSRDDVYPLAQSLAHEGIETWAGANVITPSIMTIKLSNGSDVNVTSQISVLVVMRPLVDSDTEVTVSILGYIQNGFLINYNSADIVSQDISLSGIGTVSSVDGIEHNYIVPWENRSSVDDASLNSTYESVDFSRNDYLSFPSGLTVAQIAEKKSLSYITYISDTSASVSANFTDKDKALSDFTGIKVVFPESNLLIVTNKSVSLPYNGTTLYQYSVSVPSTIYGYQLDDNVLLIKTEKEYKLNDTVNVSIYGTVIGNKIVEINDVETE